jgi:hypothetical protein
MGTLRNIGIVLKGGFGRPVSRADLYAYCEGMIKALPVPPEWKAVFDTTMFNVEGVPLTIRDYCREQLLKPSLDKIAAAPTLAMQRAECIREAMSSNVWRNLSVCLNAAKTDVGRAMIHDKLTKIFPQLDETQRTAQAVAWHVMSTAVQAYLVTLGMNLLGVSKETELQIDLCREYGRETMMLDVNIMDVIWQNHADDPEVAKELAGWKDDYINPIITRMNHLLEATKNKVVYSTFDLAEFRTAADELRAKAPFISGGSE